MDNVVLNCKYKYDDQAKKFPDSSKGVYLDDQQSQYYRFSEILKYLQLDKDSSILDLGCGNGEFYKYLNFSGYKGKYTGYDLSETLINQAKNRFNKEYFHVIDILQDDVPNFDYVIASGIFNLNFGQDELWVKQVVSAMYNIANKSVVFNAISTYVNIEEDHIFYLNPLKMSDFIIKNLSPQMLLEHSVIPYNFLIKIDKTEYWKSINA